MGSGFSKYRVEFSFALVGITLAALTPIFGGSAEVAWLAGVLATILPAFVALIKHDFAELFVKDLLITQKQTAEICDILSDLSGEPLAFARQELSGCVTRLNKIKSGRIPLDEVTYFQMIIECMQQSPTDSRILAVNAIDERRWKEDPRQVNYYKANKLALNKGVKITRAFVVDKSKDQLAQERLDVLYEQIRDERINAYVIWREDLEKRSLAFDDWVIFEKPDKKMFIAHADKEDGIRVSSAELIYDSHEISHYENKFKVLSAFDVSGEVKELVELAKREGEKEVGQPNKN